jgi:hypothetical protein
VRVEHFENLNSKCRMFKYLNVQILTGWKTAVEAELEAMAAGTCIILERSVYGNVPMFRRDGRCESSQVLLGKDRLLEPLVSVSHAAVRCRGGDGRVRVPGVDEPVPLAADRALGASTAAWHGRVEGPAQEPVLGRPAG